MDASGTLRVGRCDMYKSFRVKNFRCFKDLQINDLGRVNLIAGKNNTGKTALMEAMYLHTGNRDVKTLLRTDMITYYRSARDSYPMPRDLEEDSPSIVEWSDIFYNFDADRCIEMSAEVQNQQLTLFENESSNLRIEIIPPDTDEFDNALSQFRIEYPQSHEEFELLVFEPNEGRATFALLVNGRVRTTRQTRVVMQSRFSYPREKTSPNVDSKRFSRMRRENDTSKLIDALRVFETRLTALEFLNDGTEWRMYAEIGLPKPTLMSSMGDGINRFVSMLLEMSDVPSGVIFIDEIENGIHYSVQEDVWAAIDRFSRQMNIQVIATTHSLEMVQAAYKAFSEGSGQDEFRYHRLDKDREGNIEAVTYSEFSIEAAMSTNWDIR